MRDTTLLEDDVRTISQLASVPPILDVVCKMTGLRFAAVARVTEDRWVTCAVRDSLDFRLAPGDELDVSTTICREVLGCRSPIVIDDVGASDRFRDHRTPALYGFESYISVPIVDRHGDFFGTLCGLDPLPRKLDTPEIIASFQLFADLIAAQIDAFRDKARTERQLEIEKEIAALREEFMAVVSHDLRNPVSAILAGVRLLRKAGLEGETGEIVAHLEASARRANGLIDDLLDLARGRLGGGIPIERKNDAPLREVLEQVIEEISRTHACLIEADIEVERLSCDRKRLGQVLSNLVGNALTHGSRDHPIRVQACCKGGLFDLSVTNRGEAIPADVLPHIFKPFHRGDGETSGPGLGLGLYIASEIARAHGGTLRVSSTEAETCFTFSIRAEAVVPPGMATPA